MSFMFAKLALWVVAVNIMMLAVGLGQTEGWTMFGGNQFHDGCDHESRLIPPLQLRWQRSYFCHPTTPVSVDGQRAVFTQWEFGEHKDVCSDYDAMLVCASILDGDTLWTRRFGDVHSVSQPCLAGEVGFVIVNNHLAGSFVLAVDLTDGSTLWQSPIEAQWDEYLAPTYASGVVAFNGGVFGGVYCFEAESGDSLWFHRQALVDLWTPAIWDSLVLTYPGNTLSAFDIDSGDTSWAVSTVTDSFPQYDTYHLRSAPVVDTSLRLLFLTQERYLHAVDLNTKSLLWQRRGTFTFAGTATRPAVSDGRLYVVDSTRLLCLDALSGSTQWEFAPVTSISSSDVHPPVIVGSSVFVSLGDSAYALSGADSTLLWSYPVSGFLSASDNLLFVGGTDGKVSVFESVLVSVHEPPSDPMPDLASMSPCYPNPFNSTTRVDFTLSRPAAVRLSVYNVTGQLVYTVMEGELASGTHSAEWSGTDNYGQAVASGLYICLLQVDRYMIARKMLLVR